jgi:ABC-2 type transport system ATP-binding protein
MTPAIAISNVHKRYRDVHALRGIDLTVNQGEFFGLLGPNGAGKSTLINIIAGLTYATEGQISVLGRDVVTEYRHTRRSLGVVPQEITYDPFFTVREVLTLQAGYFGLGRGQRGWIEELISALMLNDKADANMRALSGGMKRRVLIAQALVHKPRVVILDEPTAGVDVELRKSLWTFISRLHKEGHTIVLTTHYLEEAEALCDRIAILNQGHVVALDTTRNLLAMDIGGTVYLSVTTAEPVDRLPQGLGEKVTATDGNRIEFQLRKGTDTVIEVIDALRDAGAVITDLHTEQADLEDIFVDLTHRRSS